MTQKLIKQTLNCHRCIEGKSEGGTGSLFLHTSTLSFISARRSYPNDVNIVGGTPVQLIRILLTRAALTGKPCINIISKLIHTIINLKHKQYKFQETGDKRAIMQNG